jgi:hypothetical protein
MNDKISITRYVLVFATAALLLACLIPMTSGDSPFSVNTMVSSDPLNGNQRDSVLTVDSAGNLYAAWEDDRNADLDIYFAGSTDGGALWTDPNVRVNSGGSGTVQEDPAIAATDTHVFVAWADIRSTTDYDIYFANSTDGGATWSNPNVKINTDVGTTTQNSPAIAVDSNGVVYLVWQDYRDTIISHSDIFFAKSSDGGATWTDPNVRVNSDATTTQQRDPTIAVDSQGNIYVAWEDQINGDDDIYVSKSEDGGATWSDPSIKINSDGTTEIQRNPHITVDSQDNVYITWEDRRNGDYDIYYARSTNGGSTWTDPNVRVDSDDTNTGQHNPVIAVGLNNRIYVTWHDNRNVDKDIYYAESDDGGNTWTHPNQRVNDDAAGKSQLSPSIAVDSTVTVYVVWYDDRNNDYDIFFSSLVSGIAPPPKPTADSLGVDGFLDGSPGIEHIITGLPVFNFTYNDFSGDDMSRYNISVWDSGGSSLLWFYNTTSTLASGSNVVVNYNTAPAPTDGPSLDDGTDYELRIKVANASDIWSTESTVEFHINEVLAPSGPTPADDSLISTSSALTVSWTSPGADSEGDTPVSYNWEVSIDTTFSNIIASGSGAATESDDFDANTAGVYYWRVNLNDGYETGPYGNEPDGYWNFTTFNASASNHEPVITNKGSVPTTVAINTTLTFTFTATDSDSDTLTWSMVAGVLWLEIGPANGTLYGTPSSQDKGSHEITIQVADGIGGTDSHTFTITVSDTTDGDGDGDGDSELPWLWIIIIIVIIIIIILVIFFKTRI